ncbi:hypothetical protein HMPREF0454_03450 [Hafnia alvei ATCC 51873]|uniref:Uncharacterized protein n=1 Tax=Hafnia alvei ATCC 51873 TaxID=1002364 RepID=G9YA30_HAFAL|nr:hypothetical protein HMPREF0454_03450 [Hafnia alvei ATCC 51873]
MSDCDDWFINLGHKMNDIRLICRCTAPMTVYLITLKTRIAVAISFSKRNPKTVICLRVFVLFPPVATLHVRWPRSLTLVTRCVARLRIATNAEYVLKNCSPCLTQLASE